MRRKQLYIDDHLDEALKSLAAATGKSEAEHVREALRAYLPAQRLGAEHDPLLALIGLVADDKAPDDLAEELDHYAYGVPKAHKRQIRGPSTSIREPSSPSSGGVTGSTSVSVATSRGSGPRGTV